MFTIALLIFVYIYFTVDFILARRFKKSVVRAGVKADNRSGFLYFDTGPIYTAFVVISIVWGFILIVGVMSFSNNSSDSYIVTENDGTKLSCEKTLVKLDYSPLWPGLVKEKYIIPDEANCSVIEKANKCDIADDGSAICRAEPDEGF